MSRGGEPFRRNPDCPFLVAPSIRGHLRLARLANVAKRLVCTIGRRRERRNLSVPRGATVAGSRNGSPQRETGCARATENVQETPRRTRVQGRVLGFLLVCWTGRDMQADERVAEESSSFRHSSVIHMCAGETFLSTCESSGGLLTLAPELV